MQSNRGGRTAATGQHPEYPNRKSEWISTITWDIQSGCPESVWITWDIQSGCPKSVWITLDIQSGYPEFKSSQNCQISRLI